MQKLFLECFGEALALRESKKSLQVSKFLLIWPHLLIFRT